MGDKRGNLERAIALLDGHDHIRIEAVSGFYATEPQNFRCQDWFVNAALKIRTDLLPESLLDALKQVETTMAPEGKPFRFGPRVIDLDIIYFDDWVLKTERLEIPHPRMQERCFVLVPVCDIGAHEIHPVLGLRTDELLKRIDTLETQKVFLLDKEV